MVGCDVSVKRILCRVVKSVPFDVGGDVVAAFVARAQRAYEAGQAQPPHASFGDIPEVETYKLRSGIVRMVGAERPAGQSVDYLA
jgi:hypothetical protein